MWKSVILPQSKSSIYVSYEIYYSSLSKDFGAKAFCSLVKRRVKTENPFSTFADEGVINSEIMKSIIKHLFEKQTG